jgi:hypothetical protein
MNPMANAFWLGLERSDMFVDLFSTDISGDDWLQKPNGIPNPPIWIIGHLAFQRARFLEMLTGRKTYDDSWIELFELGCNPSDVQRYPGVEVCRSFMADRLTDLKAYLETASEEDLKNPTCVSSEFFKSKAAALVHLTHHEAHHSGEMALIRYMLGKEKII